MLCAWRKEEGGRIYGVVSKGKETMLTFGRNDLDLRQVHIGDRIWKTSDPELDKQLRQSFAAENPQFQRPIDVEVYGEIGQPLIAIARDRLGNKVRRIVGKILCAAELTKPTTICPISPRLVCCPTWIACCNCLIIC